MCRELLILVGALERITLGTGDYIIGRGNLERLGKGFLRGELGDAARIHRPKVIERGHFPHNPIF